MEASSRDLEAVSQEFDEERMALELVLDTIQKCNGMGGITASKISKITMIRQELVDRTVSRLKKDGAIIPSVSGMNTFYILPRPGAEGPIPAPAKTETSKAAREKASEINPARKPKLQKYSREAKCPICNGILKRGNANDSMMGEALVQHLIRGHSMSREHAKKELETRGYDPGTCTFKKTVEVDVEVAAASGPAPRPEDKVREVAEQEVREVLRNEPSSADHAKDPIQGPEELSALTEPPVQPYRERPLTFREEVAMGIVEPVPSLPADRHDNDDPNAEISAMSAEELILHGHFIPRGMKEDRPTATWGMGVHDVLELVRQIAADAGIRMTFVYGCTETDACKRERLSMDLEG